MSVRVKTSSGWVNVAGNELGLISKQWNEDDTYTIGEYVYHKSFIWKCLAQNENEEPTDDSEYWEKIDSVMSEVFQYVDNGKELVADAITDKGVATSKTDTFATMATNISQISGGGGLPDIDFSQPPLYRNEIEVVQKASRDCVYSPNLPKGRYAFIFYTYYYTTSDISYSIGSIKVNNTAITNYHTDINSKDKGGGYEGQGLTAVGVVDINDTTDTITVNCNFVAYPTLYIYKLNGSGGGGGLDPEISVNAQISDTTHYMTANTLQDYAKFQQILIDIVVADTHYYTLKNTSDIVSGEEFVVNSHRGANVMKIILTSSTVSATYYTGSFVNVYCNILGIGGASEGEVYDDDEEVVIGTYNGETLYRRKIHETVTKAYWGSIDISSYGMKKVTNYYGNIIFDNGMAMPCIYYLSSSYFGWIDIAYANNLPANIGYYFNYSQNTDSIDIWLEYTKV